MLPSRWWSAEWQSADLEGHYSSHPCPRVANRETPSRMDKKVAPDKEGVVDKQCLEKGNSDSKPEQMALQVSLSGRKKLDNQKHGWRASKKDVAASSGTCKWQSCIT